MRHHLAHRYFDTAHAILQPTVDDDLPELERAIRAMVKTLPEEDQPSQDASIEGTPTEEELPSKNRQRISRISPDTEKHARAENSA